MARADVLKIASSWLGAKEGSDQHKQIIDIYNSQNPLPVGYKVKLTDAWCQIFVTTVFLQAGLVKLIVPECGCQRAVNEYKSKGMWRAAGYIPSPGDIIYYDWNKDGVSDHVGIVECVQDHKITVIEGNVSDSVGKRILRTNSKNIMGFAHVNYDEQIIIKPTTPEEFLAIIKPMVIRDAEATGILASLTAAQAALESGWGKSSLTDKYNNLFGMKKSTDWTGQTVDLKTRELIDGVYVEKIATFKVYDSWQHSIDDHSALFLKYDRYKGLINEKDYKEACHKVYKAGYATGANYDQNLINLIERYKLFEWDNLTSADIQDYIAPTSGSYQIYQYNLHPVKYGTTGAEAKFLQQMLIAQGYGCGIDGADGEVGDYTYRAMALYMLDNKLLEGTDKLWTSLINKCR